jgi:hypothetical protein
MNSRTESQRYETSLTTYLTRTGGGGDGYNGENGEKKGQKRSKKARNGLKKDIKAIVFRLGARCRRFEPCHSDHVERSK